MIEQPDDADESAFKGPIIKEEVNPDGQRVAVAYPHVQDGESLPKLTVKADTFKPTCRGVMKFMPIETLIDSRYGLPRQSLVDEYVEIYGGVPIRKTTSDWPRVTNAINRGELFVIEAKSPAHSLELSFSPAKQEGTFRIRKSGSAPTQSGKVVKVTKVPSDEGAETVGLIAKYSVSYVVITVSDQSKNQLAWLIGVDGIRTVPESQE